MPENRRFYRHPAHVPIEVWQEKESTYELDQLNNVSLGGVAFESDTCWKPGSIITFRVLLNPPCHFTGKVVWCRKHDEHFEVGVQFLEKNSATKEKLVDDVCQFEIYQKIWLRLLEDFYESQLEYSIV